MAQKQNADRAVSPVIGVILMVAITVILAAVIGAFVLGIGPDQDPAPQGTYQLSDSDEEHSIQVRHRGGDRLDFEDITITLAGDDHDPEEDGSYSYDDSAASATEYTGPESLSTGSDGDFEFDSGEFDLDDADFDEGEFDVVLIHEPSDSIIREGTVTIFDEQ